MAEVDQGQDGKASDKQTPTPSQNDGGRKQRMWLFVVLGAAVVIFALYNTVELIRRSRLDPRFSPVRRVNMEEVQTPSASGSHEDVGKPTLRVAIAPVISPEKSLETYKGFVDYLARELNRDPLSLQRDTYAETNDLVRFGRCDVAFVCTYAFILGEREFGMDVVAVPQIGGVTTYHSYIVVPQSSKASSLLDLRGRRFGSADILSNSGWLYPVTWLKKRGEDPDVFFGKHVITGSHDESVAAVAGGYVDGAAVDSLVYDQMVEEDPSLGTTTKVILKSPPFGMPPMVVPRQISPELREEILAVLLEMHKDAEGKKILESLRIERFVVPEEGLFDSVREASKILEAN